MAEPATFSIDRSFVKTALIISPSPASDVAAVNKGRMVNLKPLRMILQNKTRGRRLGEGWARNADPFQEFIGNIASTGLEVQVALRRDEDLPEVLQIARPF